MRTTDRTYNSCDLTDDADERIYRTRFYITPVISPHTRFMIDRRRNIVAITNRVHILHNTYIA